MAPLEKWPAARTGPPPINGRHQSGGKAAPAVSTVSAALTFLRKGMLQCYKLNYECILINENGILLIRDGNV